MIIYSASKEEFVNDVFKNRIDDKVLEAYKDKVGKANIGEIKAWRNSLMYMSNILVDKEIPNSSNVAIEYQVPNTSKRVDFIIAGKDIDNKESVIIVELKQWDKLNKTTKDGIVNTYVGGGNREVTHPSYQAWTYAKLIKEYNETVQRDNINIYPCAYLHNYKNSKLGDPILDSFYQEYLDKAPSFLRDDTEVLSDFIKKYIKYGDDKDILYRIDNGRIRPSKSLGDSIGSMLKGNKEFFMIEDQKVVYETLRELALEKENNNKKVVIIEGGPGTGKSVIAINLLAELIKNQVNTQYVTRNSAPREVYSALLKKDFKKSFIDNLFKGSGSYVNSEENYFDCLIVDEAHRLNKKSGFLRNKGENQIKEIINSAELSIFFVDDAQQVTIHDIGSVEEIRSWAEEAKADVYEMNLSSQFRCNGSDGYLAWIDNKLEIRETANTNFSNEDFDFKIFDDPNKLRDAIFEKNKENNKARLLAGYCWDWKKDKRNFTDYHDIVIPQYNFSMSWNLGNDGMKFIIEKDSVNEVGCIHTSQGLEVDYVGVVIGGDMRYSNGRIITDVSKRAKTDQSVKGWKKGMRETPIETEAQMDKIIKNTYRTLLTRGMKGCYVYIEDQGLREHFRKYIV